MDIIKTYTKPGIEHILLGIDHLLFVLMIIKLLSYKKNWPIFIKKIPAYAIGSMAAFWLIERVVRRWPCEKAILTEFIQKFHLTLYPSRYSIYVLY